MCFCDIVSAFRVHYFSPFPTSVMNFMNNEIFTIPGKSYLWYFFSKPIFIFMLLSFLLICINDRCKSILSDVTFFVIFFLMPMFCTFIYGVFSNSMTFLGPRQGLPFAALLLFFLIPYTISFYCKFIKWNYSICLTKLMSESLTVYTVWQLRYVKPKNTIIL